MAVAFTKVSVGPLRLALPNTWSWRRTLAGGAVDALHIQLEPEVSLEVQVLHGLGSPEGLAEVMGMHGRAGEGPPAPPPPLALPTGPTTSSMQRLEQGQRRLRREVHAFIRGLDLVVALISWDRVAGAWPSRPTADQIARHRRWIELLLHAAVSELPRSPTPAAPVGIAVAQTQRPAGRPR